ncbi:unnamed protein product, partial [Closterium sp. NIES-53]
MQLLRLLPECFSGPPSHHQGSRGLCSGCSLNAALDRPPIIAEAEAFFEARGVAGFKLHTADVVEWRCRAKLAVRGTAEEPLVGLYAARSHDVVDIPMCRGAVRWSE